MAGERISNVGLPSPTTAMERALRRAVDDAHCLRGLSERDRCCVVAVALGSVLADVQARLELLQRQTRDEA